MSIELVDAPELTGGVRTTFVRVDAASVQMAKLISKMAEETAADVSEPSPTEPADPEPPATGES